MKGEAHISDFSKKVLLKSNWSPDRKNDKCVERWNRRLSADDENFVMFPAAERILRQYGGVRVEQSAAGIDYARETFEIDPLLAIGEADRFSAFEAEIGQKLYPLGECGASHFFLAIAEDGKVFGLMMNIFLIGNNFEQALENLISGKNPESD